MAVLQEQNHKVHGLLDNLKKGEDICNAPEQCKAYDAIFVVAGPNQDAICLGLITKGFDCSKIWLQREAKGYNSPIVLFKLSYFQHLNQWLKAVAKQMLTLIAAVLPKNKIVYYAEQFFDTNVLLMYRKHRTLYPSEPVFLVGYKINSQSLPELVSDKNVLINAFSVSWYLLTAKCVVIDHQYLHGLFNSLRSSFLTVQLWHGLPYKSLTGNKHYQFTDTVFVSSSAWFNENVFQKIFNATRFESLGYPRNDALVQKAEDRDWINCLPPDTLTRVQSETGPLVVYMPTYRDKGDNSCPLNFSAFNAFCQKHHLSFVMKLHPFVARLVADQMGLSLGDTLVQAKDYPHIYFYPSGKNIYPWLADSRCLISDYSSVVLDFLLLPQPVIYYQYDKASYLDVRGAPLIDDTDFVFGAVATDQQQLETELLRIVNSDANDHDVSQRQRLRQLFGLKPTPCTADIINMTRRLMSPEQ